MYFFLLVLHSLIRWLVLSTLLLAVYISYRGWRRSLPFSRAANRVRHWTATAAHIQLLVGMAVYMQSPVVASSLLLPPGEWMNEQVFFKYIHILLMVLAIVSITIGSAKAKRTTNHRQKYKVMLVWFCIGLMIILLAIPWPFSPLAGRPLLRAF